MKKTKNKKIKKAFIKTLVLVIVFCVLILFSIQFFNRDQNVLSEVPFVNNILDFIINISDWIDKNINEKVDFGRFFRQN
jgi:hypothetical protein